MADEHTTEIGHEEAEADEEHAAEAAEEHPAEAAEEQSAEAAEKQSAEAAEEQSAEAAEEHPAEAAEEHPAEAAEEHPAEAAEEQSAEAAEEHPAEAAEERAAEVAEEHPAEAAEEQSAEADEEQSAEADEELPAEADVEVKPVPDDGIRRRWYAVHAYSGQEANVKKNLMVHAEQAGLADAIGQIMIPMEEVAEIKAGEKKISKRKFFPGYVLVQLPEHPERNADLWHMIRQTPGVAGFIGSRTVPVPLEDSEIEAIQEEIRGDRERPKPKVKFERGERIKIIDGPFSNFLGNIDTVDLERGKLKVMVEIFERLTSVEVEFWQVEKI